MRKLAGSLPLVALGTVLGCAHPGVARGQGLPASFISPLQGSVGIGTAHVFKWTAVPSAFVYDLSVGTSAGAQDLVQSGRINQTSYLVSGLPKDRTLYARIWTLQSDGWRYSQISFHTSATEPREVFPLIENRTRRTLERPDFAGADFRFLFPEDGAQNVDSAFPFAWTEIRGASYRLEIGSRPGASDLSDSGVIEFPRRFVQGLPQGRTLYATVWAYLGEKARSWSSTFTLGPPSSPLDAKMAAVLWATHYVRQMADAQNYPFPGTPLAKLTTSEGYAGAYCTDYATVLVAGLQDMDVGLATRVLNVFMNTNFYDAHTLVELFHPLQNEWILLDPTFDMTMRRASDGLWATADDMTRATLSWRWNDILYVPLGPEGLQYAHAYYLDYPLLYLNPLPSTDSFTPGRGNSPLPYFQELSAPPTGLYGIYVVQAPSVPAVEISVDGTEYFFSCQGIDDLSQAFGASNIELVSGSPPNLTVYRLRRFVF